MFKRLSKDKPKQNTKCKKSKNSQKLVEYRLILQLKPLGLNETVGLNPKTFWRKETVTLATIW